MQSFEQHRASVMPLFLFSSYFTVRPMKRKRMHYILVATHSSNVNALSKNNFQILTISFDDHSKIEEEAYIILTRRAN